MIFSDGGARENANVPTIQKVAENQSQRTTERRPVTSSRQCRELEIFESSVPTRGTSGFTGINLECRRGQRPVQRTHPGGL